MVRLVFEGDPLPGGEVDRLVPVRREASVDEDLLEDSQTAIETYLHTQGYRDATAMYTRQESAGELVITFRIARGPRFVVRGVALTGNFVLPTQQLLPLVRLKEGEPFVRSTLAMGVAAIESFYRTSGFTRPQLKATESVIAPEDVANPDRLVTVTIAIVEGPRTEVRSVTFQGNMALNDAELRTRISTAPGRVYSVVDIQSDREAIVQAYHDRGFESVVGHAAADVCRERHTRRRPLHDRRRAADHRRPHHHLRQPPHQHRDHRARDFPATGRTVRRSRRGAEPDQSQPARAVSACADRGAGTFGRDASRRPGAGRRVPVDDGGPLGRRRGRILREANR